MATGSSNPGQDSRHQATAIQHALILEEKKKLKTRIIDLVLEAYDLPSQKVFSPAKASTADIKLFRTCLRLFQPSDFDDLVRERNIDDRCGYALCSNRNEKVSGEGEKAWNRKGGKEFRIVDRAELEKWCSTECGQRGAFVRAQLSTEPAWLRDSQNENALLLDEVPKTDDLVDALEKLVINGAADGDLNAKLKALSMERGELKVAKHDSIAVVEKESGSTPNELPVSGGDGSVEGHRPRQV